MRVRHGVGGLLIAGTIGAVAVTSLAQQGGAPVARYDMRAGTVSGMAAMGAGSMMGMMLGGGGSNRSQHELYLRLGSQTAPAKGGPKADHFMPPTAKLGKSVALVTPKQERVPDELPEKPRGRLLLFWGCGEHAPKGQPVVIDFAKVAAGQVPPGLWTTTVIRDWGPSLTNSKTFGRWPADDGKFVKAESSLIGAHRIASNYAPEISFTLARDFMAPLSVTTAGQPSGAIRMNWSVVPTTTAHLAVVVGGKQNGSGDMGDMVMWTSSATRNFGGGLGDWISPGQAASLVRDRTLLPASATTCTVPAEVKNASPDFRVGTLTAFGPEETFAYPPRPASGPWKLEWTSRVRHRSTTSWMEAQGMSMGGGEAGAGATGQPECKRKGGFGGLGGLGGVLGGNKGC